MTTIVVQLFNTYIACML